MNRHASTAYGAAQTVQIQRERVVKIARERSDEAERIERACDALERAADALLGLSRALDATTTEDAR